MPTENRSSNTEKMVSLPLDLVELALAHLPSDSAAGFELRELLGQPAAQNQGEPVAWINPHWDGKSAKFVFGSNLVDEPCPELWKPLYTHTDTGEVERLRNELGEAKGEYDRSANRVAALRVQLAERDSLLRNFIEESEQDFVSLVTVDRAKVALSASTEPAPVSDGFSAEQMTAQGADGYRNGIKAAAELAADYPELAQAIRALPLPR